MVYMREREKINFAGLRFQRRTKEEDDERERERERRRCHVCVYV